MISLDHILLHLSLIDGIGPATVQKILTRGQTDQDLNVLYALTVADVARLFDFCKNISAKIVSGLRDKSLLDKELALIEKHHIKWVTLVSDLYPSMLKEIYLPPIVLYYAGVELQKECNALAVVGSRKANEYGRQVIKELLPPLVQHGWTIVSGGAIGADSMAHRATIDAGGQTVVVLGSGLLYPYPACNRKLFEDVIKCGGTLVSSFPLAMQAMPGHFPARNRIIAGLSRGCLVIQAAEKSGASITARFALDQGREVFAVPGAIYDSLSAGCHALIGQGAKLVSDSQDIVQEFGQEFGRKFFSLEERIADPEHQTIIQVCRQPASVDHVAAQLQLPVDQALCKLFELQLKGMVRQNFMGLWQLI